MKNTGKTAVSAMLCALAAVIMYAGSLFGKIDIAVAVIASVCVSLALVKFGYFRAFAVYGVSAFLALLLCPVKTVPVMFAAFFGYYPVLKMYAETKFSKVFSYVIKYVSLNVSLVLLVAMALRFAKIHALVIAAVFAASNILLPVYDIAYGMAVSMCFERLFGRK